MKKNHFFTVVFIIVSCLSCRETIKLSCLGDSVTQGTRGHDHLPRLNSYRYALWEKLDSAGYRIDMVGSTRLLFNEKPDSGVSYPVSRYTGHRFDPDHEGHWGWTTGNILDHLPQWLANYKPDIVIIHLGNNDVAQKQDSAAIAGNLKRIIQILRLKNPRVKIVLAQLMTVWCTQVNHAVPLIAAELSTPGSPVVTVDLATGFINDPGLPGTLTCDWAHPNPAGEEWMARRLFVAVTGLTGVLNVNLPK